MLLLLAHKHVEELATKTAIVTVLKVDLLEVGTDMFPFARVVVHLSAQKIYGLGTEGVNGFVEIDRPFVCGVLMPWPGYLVRAMRDGNPVFSHNVMYHFTLIDIE